jgi:hypothetical protein
MSAAIYPSLARATDIGAALKQLKSDGSEAKARRALPHDYQCEQTGAEQSDAHERNRQKSKRCEFFTHVCVAKESPRSDHHKSGDAQSRAAQNDDWRD